MKNLKNIWLIVSILDTIAILILSLISKSTILQISIFDLASVDKLGHCSMYGLDAFCIGMWTKIKNLKISYCYTKIFAFLFTMGSLMEILQYLMAYGRTLDYLDQLANTIGILIGLTCFHRYSLFLVSGRNIND
ncbi:MAG: VanZ family protein [Saprospiraceae bacterium]